jgi:hypothetical protein
MRSLPDRHFVTNPRLCPRKKHALLAAILASGKYGHVYLSYRSRLFTVHWDDHPSSIVGDPRPRYLMNFRLR